MSPVVFMVDDFCNVWVDTNGNGQIDLGEDWGYAQRGPGSSLAFMEDQLLRDFPEVKVTFFVPVGVRAGVITNPQISAVAKMINSDQQAKDFFRSVGENPRYEVAYHGTTHGTPGPEASDFVQEWATYQNLAQAMETISAGTEVFQEVFGFKPSGGKYCGYVTNSFSDLSIEQSGFVWWCRFSNVGLYETKNCVIGGQDFNRLTNFDVKYFGSRPVVDIPTTLPGMLFNRLLDTNSPGLKSTLKRILKPILLWRTMRHIDFLLQNRLVVSIQEHISPARVDGRRQMPNIFDDLTSLRIILTRLNQYPVWYCTCSELASYVLLRDNIRIHIKSASDFHLESSGVGRDKLTLKLYDCVAKAIVQPDGTIVPVLNQLADVKVMQGIYTIVAGG
ncbi:MAG: hypothetical protein M0Z55_11210 [Peptococcaceae bacterium]|nr:hypothetical protein [Peptococcaceae bacterium]